MGHSGRSNVYMRKSSRNRQITSSIEEKKFNSKNKMIIKGKKKKRRNKTDKMAQTENNFS